MHLYEIMLTREVTTTETVARTIVAQDHLRAWRLAEAMAAGFDRDSPVDAQVSDGPAQCDHWRVNPEDIHKVEEG